MRALRLFCGFCLLLAPPPLAARKPASPAGDSAPQLVSTGPKWKTPAELRRFAEQGDPQACAELGDRLLGGDGLPADTAEARIWLERAARGGVGEAMFRLGKLHHDATGGPRDFARALEFYGLAAQAGIPEAQHNIGAMLVSARGVKRDYVEGLAWLIVAARNGAASDAGQRTRERLAGRSADIAAAEKRAQEIVAALEIRAGDAARPRYTLADGPPPPPSAATPPRPPVGGPEKVKVDLGPPPAPPKPGISLPKN